MHPLLVTRLPFMGTTSLLQVAWLQQSFFPGPSSSERVGVVTFKKSALVSWDSLLYERTSTCHLLTIYTFIDNKTFNECRCPSRYTSVRAARG